MGEWSEHFENFPEENPANYVGGDFDPVAAESLREHEKAKTNVAEESKELMKKMFAMAEAAKKTAAERMAGGGQVE